MLALGPGATLTLSFLAEALSVRGSFGDSLRLQLDGQDISFGQSHTNHEVDEAILQCTTMALAAQLSLGTTFPHIFQAIYTGSAGRSAYIVDATMALGVIIPITPIVTTETPYTTIGSSSITTTATVLPSRESTSSPPKESTSSPHSKLTSSPPRESTPSPNPSASPFGSTTVITFAQLELVIIAAVLVGIGVISVIGWFCWRSRYRHRRQKRANGYEVSALQRGSPKGTTRAQKIHILWPGEEKNDRFSETATSSQTAFSKNYGEVDGAFEDAEISSLKPLKRVGDNEDSVDTLPDYRTM